MSGVRRLRLKRRRNGLREAGYSATGTSPVRRLSRSASDQRRHRRFQIGIYVCSGSLLLLIRGRVHVPTIITIDGFEGFFPTEEIFEWYFLLLLSARAVFHFERFLIEHKLVDFAERNWCGPACELNAFAL